MPRDAIARDLSVAVPPEPFAELLITVAEAQRLVDGFDGFFRAAVRDARKLGAREASAVWTGFVWLAGEAKRLGLVDRVEALDATIERLTAPMRARNAKARLAK